jgi:hypothetical protein
VKARKAPRFEATGPLVIGFDPAWMGADSSAMAWRRGRQVIKVERRSKLDTMESAGWLSQVIERDKPKRVFLGGVGAGVYDRLREMGFETTVVAINFGGKPFEPPPIEGGGPLNRRAEM